MLVLALLPAARTHAAPLTLSFAPPFQTHGIGDAFSVDVVIGGLDPANSAELISAFDLDVVFDPLVLAFAGVTFGTSLGAGFDQFGDAIESGGVLDVVQFSFLSDADLEALQPGASVTLFTIDFIGLAAGASSLAFDTATQYVAGALDFSVDPAGVAATLDVGVESGGVTIRAATPVPAPATLWLVAAGLAGLVLRGRSLRLA
jgi:hypothetical protein